MSASKRGGTGSEELRRIFEQSPDPVLSAVEVAEEMEITQQAAHAKLTKAHEQGCVKRKKVGSRAVVWWFPDQDCDSA